MPHSSHRDHPDYAVDVIAGARPIGTQLSVAAGILAVILVAMSAVATPMPPHDPVTGDGLAIGMEEPASSGQRPLCLIGNKVRDWIAVAVA